MKKLFTYALGIFLNLVMVSSPSWAHPCDTPPCFEIETELTTPVDAGKIEYEFEIFDELKKVMIKNTNLNIHHEKLLHMIVFDPALAEFQHVHPEFKNDKWVVDLDFSTNGRYWIYLHGFSADHEKEFTINTRLTVKGGKPANPIISLGDQRVGASGFSKVTLSPEVLKAKRDVMPVLTFSRTNGERPELTPYLGALAHVVVAGQEGNSFLHVHPMEGRNPNQLMLHTKFPKEGEYRVWVQFVDSGELKTVPLSVNVVK